MLDWKDKFDKDRTEVEFPGWFGGLLYTVKSSQRTRVASLRSFVVFVILVLTSRVLILVLKGSIEI